jgi:Short C-terminal domain
MRPTPARKTGLSDELIRLAHLCQAGILTRAEFEAAKARTLAEYWITPTKDCGLSARPGGDDGTPS